MGWKSIRDHYRIEHIVTVDDGVVSISSPLVTGIVTISHDGTIIKEYDRPTGDFARYQREIENDPETFARLLAQADSFSADIRVYTWHDAEIIETLCERTGWPNVTHDGHLMHDNRYSTDRDEVVEWARSDALSAIRAYRHQVEETRSDLKIREARLEQALEVCSRIEREHPVDVGQESAC